MSQWHDWIRENPPPRGVNWIVPMEAAIRAINWLWALVLLKRATGRDHADREITRLLVEHGRFIDFNLEYSERPSDHYLSNLIGLLYLGCAFQEASFGRRWIRIARRRLMRRARVDVASDGGFPVGSVGYHGLVTELFTHGAAVCRAVGLPLGVPLSSLIARQQALVDAMKRPDGTPIAFGDGDDGRVVPDLTDTVVSSAASLSSARHRTPAGGNLVTVAYPDTGFYVMRSGDSGCAIDAFSERPNLPFGYRHNSRLSVELWARGQSIIIDPG